MSKKQEIFEFIASCIRHYSQQEHEVEQMLKLYPNFPAQEKEGNRQAVLLQLEELQRFFGLIFPIITRIKSYVPKITDQNRMSACYLLFGKTVQSFQAIFLLAQEGFAYEVMEILRGIKESLGLIHLFLEEKENNPTLKKWFKGEIITNSAARDAQDRFVNQHAKALGLKIPFKEGQAHIYTLFSMYSHISYGALLESYDAYSRDFDFQRFAGFHRMNHTALLQTRIMLESTILALKHFYSVAGDVTTYQQLTGILEKLSPRMVVHDYEQQVRKNVATLKERFAEG